jgi:hypothetical protein
VFEDADMTRRERVVEIADYLARHLEALRSEEASAARVLRAATFIEKQLEPGAHAALPIS